MSMNREQMMRYMEDPSLLNERTLNELKEILQEFPYFHAAHLLYMRNLSNEKNFRFESQLRISALHTVDRTVLYHLLHPKVEKEAAAQSLEPEIAVTSHAPAISPDEEPTVISSPVTFELADDTPITETPTEEVVIEPEPVKDRPIFDLIGHEPVETAYRLEGSEPENEKPLEEIAADLINLSVKRKSSAPAEVDLIDKYLRQNPVMGAGYYPGQKEEELPPLEDETKENEDFITETLARIYLKQGFYQKAIKAFQRLSLKYPEKSIYFARQIEEITKLINK